MYGIISPSDWELTPAGKAVSADLKRLCGITMDELNLRCERCIGEWLPRQIEPRSGAFYGHYDAEHTQHSPPGLVNLIGPWLLMAAFDRGGDMELLAKAVRAAEWLISSDTVCTHPMSLVIGGVREPGTQEVWVKYAAEYVMLNAGLYQRTGQKRQYLERALQSGRFLIQAARHDHAARKLRNGEWTRRGWQAVGRMIEAFLILYELTGDGDWRRLAVMTGEHALGRQADDGCFYLIDDEYYNSDLAADPLRALVYLYEETTDKRYMDAAKKFADWHIRKQSSDGSWPVNIDSEGNVVCPIAGPGDMPNIAVALLRLHFHTRDPAHLSAAARSLCCSLSVQVTADASHTHPFGEDPNVLWGFWSWQPHYDYSLSMDQATHHIRGLYFLADYLAAGYV